MKYIIAILLLVFVLLQARLWTGTGSLAEIARLENAIEGQTDENVTLSRRNEELKDEVKDLRNGLDSIEERARSELGLIKEGETFFLIVEDKPLHEQPAASFEELLVEPFLEMPPEPGPESALDFSSESDPLEASEPAFHAPAQPLQNEGDSPLAETNATNAARSSAEAADQKAGQPSVNSYLELFRDEEPAPASPQQ